VAEPGPGADATVHDLVGGEAFFVELVDRFYAGVAEDPVLRSLYPDDLTDSKRWLAGFLTQYWGGSQAYSAERGHPRLRMRHVPFRIGPAERDAWFRHMVSALSSLAVERELPVEVEQRMREYFSMAAEAMRNAD
jgi:hemoglobin